MRHLEIFGLDESATFDDIKSAYRQLAKQYHPDVNKNGTEKFREIKTSYEWLMKNHHPKKPMKSAKGYLPYFEILGPNQVEVTINLFQDSDIVDEGIVIYLMKGYNEYRVFVEKGTKIPTKLVLTNVGPSIIIHLKNK